MSAAPGVSRRQALKVIAAAVGTTSLNSLPARWQTPVIEAGTLPAHAQTSAQFYQVALLRELTPCENHGKHHIFIWVRDQAGNGLNDVPVKIKWADTQDGFVVAVTETKTNLQGILQAGHVDFAMFKGNYWVSIFNEPGETAGPVTADDAVNEPCGEDQLANSPYHKSFEIIFERV